MPGTKFTKLQITAHNPSEQRQALDKIKRLGIQVSLSHPQHNVDKIQQSLTSDAVSVQFLH